MRTLIFGISLFFAQIASAQSFSGVWKGQFNGDAIQLSLSPNGQSGAYTGTLEDSQQRYNVVANMAGQELVGKATEQSMGLTLDMKATTSAQGMVLTLGMAGLELGQVPMQRQGSGASANTNTPQKSNATTKLPTLPAHAQHDAAVTGVWRKEENYNSGPGYGGGYSSASYMAFNADGSLTDMGGSTVISGGNFSGNSSGQGSGVIPGVAWYTYRQELWLVATDGTQTESAKLGRYYIENGAMLITADDGTKALFYRQ